MTTNRVKCPGDRSAAQGFTLIELMITVSLVAVVFAVGLPSFNTFIREIRLDSATDVFYAQILAARSEAVKRGGTVILCRTGDPLNLAGAANPSCRAAIRPGGGSLSSRDWSHGWLMYATPPGYSGERDYTPGSGDVLLAVGGEDAAARGVDITSNTVGNSWMTFQGNGSLNESGLARYVICDDRGAPHGRQVTVFLDGQARIDSVPAGEDCDPNT